MKTWAKIIERILYENRKKKQWNAIALVTACVVVFVTTYSLILPAITMEKNAAQDMAGFDLLIDEAGDLDGGAAATAGSAGDEMLADEIQIEDPAASFSTTVEGDDLLIDDLTVDDQLDDLLVIDDNLIDDTAIDAPEPDKVENESVLEEETEEEQDLQIEAETEEIAAPVIEEQEEETAKPVIEEQEEETAKPVIEEQEEETAETVIEEQTEETAETVIEEQTEEIAETMIEEETEEAGTDIEEEVVETFSEEETEEETEEAAETVPEEAAEAATEEETEEAVESVLEEMPEDDTETVFEEETEEETEDIIEKETEEVTEEETESELSYPASIFTAAVADLEVKVYAGEGAFPEGTTMTLRKVEEKEILRTVADTVEQKITGIQAVDITFRDRDGNEIEPLRPIRVQMTDKKTENAENADSVQVVHVDNDGVTTPVEQFAQKTTGENEERVSFNADAFSVYALVYTVDFHWEANGKTYQFSIPGGGFASFYNLIKDLGIKADDADTEEDEIQELVDGIETIEFSSPELVSVSKVEEDTTAGAIKEHLGLECEYSAELTEELIEKINAQEAKAGDWALISLKPFTTEESLTVTMKNGDQWTVEVTDAQLLTHYLTDNGELYEVTVTYGDEAGIPEGSSLKVTEFEEDSEEYTYALNSVLADKKARGEAVDLNALGFAALDISIINPEGEEIEPEAAVQVDMQIKSLPGVEDLSEVTDTLAIQHHVEVEDGVVVETVYGGAAEASFQVKTAEEVTAEATAVDPESVTEEDFSAPVPVEETELDVAFETTAFSTFSISWNNAYGNGTKIHYVDEAGNELTVKNTTLPTTLGANSTSPAYLIYDIEGYEYSYTYYNKVNTKIYPQLYKAKYGWAYYDEYGYGRYLDTYQDIYVVYKKKNDIAQGGTPTVKQSGSVEPPVAPRINKESTPNGDDTNTLALSLISDTAKLEVEKLADVIVVFDVSGSMSTRDMGNYTTRLQAAQKAVKDLADELAKKKNSNGEPLVRMSLIQFSTKANPVMGLTDLTTDGYNSGLNQIKSAVNNLTANGGTNWDHALQLANEESDLDFGRATFVIFVTDGDPTFRHARMDVTDYNLQGETNNTSGAYNPYYLSDNVYGPGDNDKTGQCYDAAVIQGNAIVSAGKNIFTIGISNDVQKVQTFNSDIHGNGAYLAANSDALEQAFADIEASISGAAGWGNIQMTDGITKLSNTVQKTGLTNVGGDFTYWMAPAPSNWASMTETQKNAYKPAASDFVEWDPVAAGAALADYNEQTGAVEWNMGSTFMPEAGVTYQVRFKVWPSQEAYDYIAKLNNGTIKYDELSADVRAQIIKNGNTYTLKTNEPDARTTYQPAVKSGNTVTVSGETKTLMFPTVEDLNLSVDKMKIKKEWVNDLDPDARWKSDVTLLLTDGSGNLYKSIELNEDNNYTDEENFISCGLAKIENGELIIYENGHDFKLTEPEEYAYYWDLDSQIYRPMIINAHLTMLVKTDAPSGMEDQTYYTSDGKEYFKIEGGIYQAISEGDAAAAITATNIRRSNLNLTKKVVDENGNPAISSEPFEFTITINDTKDADIWFSVQTDPNDTTTVVKDLSTNATAELKNGEKTGYYHAASGSQITVSIEPGWNLRFTNLPNGTTYTIEEGDQENYSFKDASIDNNGTFSITDGTTVGTGTISESNTQYTVTYTNEAVTQQVYIHKTDQTGQNPLQGAVFSLYTKDGYEANPQKVMKTNLVSDEDGKIDLGRLVVGEYRLVETSAPEGYILLTDPVEITVKKNEVQYKQITNSHSSSREGVSGDNATGYTLVVINNAGYELPSTGGPGTNPIYFFGIMLMGLAGAGFVMRRRRNAV